MAAEASRAPVAVRERPIAPTAQRLKNITVHAARPARIDSAPPLNRETLGLRIFDAIPPRYGVLPVAGNSVLFRTGEVAVYDELWTHEGLLDGGVYVMENQHPSAGMSWDLYDQYYAFKGTGRSLLDVRRSIVRVEDNAKWKGWIAHPLATRENGVLICADGPYDKFVLSGSIIGKVVGIYSPATIAGSAAA